MQHTIQAPKHTLQEYEYAVVTRLPSSMAIDRNRIEVLYLVEGASVSEAVKTLKKEAKGN